IEPIDIKAEQFQHLWARWRLGLGLIRQRGQYASAAIKGGLHAADGGIHQLGNFLERIAEHVLQKHTRPSLSGRLITRRSTAWSRGQAQGATDSTESGFTAAASAFSRTRAGG